MKKYLVPLLMILVLVPSERAFSIFGVGIYGAQDSYTIDQYEESWGFKGIETDLVSFTRTEIGKPLGLGGFLYIDAIPFIDLEVSGEIAIKRYDFTFSNASATSFKVDDIPFARWGGHVTIKRKIFGLPMFKLHAGAGMSIMGATPLASVDAVEEVVPSASGELDSSELKNFLSKESRQGFHAMLGLRLKPIAIPVALHVTARYNIIEDVNPDGNFLTLMLGLAFAI